MWLARGHVEQVFHAALAVYWSCNVVRCCVEFAQAQRKPITDYAQSEIMPDFQSVT